MLFIIANNFTCLYFFIKIPLKFFQFYPIRGYESVEWLTDTKQKKEHKMKKTRADKIRDFMVGQDFLTTAEIAKGIKAPDSDRVAISSFLVMGEKKGFVTSGKYLKVCTITEREVKAYKLIEPKKTAPVVVITPAADAAPKKGKAKKENEQPLVIMSDLSDPDLTAQLLMAIWEARGLPEETVKKALHLANSIKL